MAQLAMCVSDCACNAAIGFVLARMNRGGQFLGCVPGPGPEAGMAAQQCLLNACFFCAGCTGLNVPDAGADGGNCAPMGGGGSFGINGQCDSTLNKTCNGTNYQIICSCPDAKCACFGPTSQVIPYSGCPYCPGGGPTRPNGPPPNDLFAQCGFP